MDTERVRRWIYNLWYPALLGTFGISVAGGRPSPSLDVPGWEWVIILYLTIEFGEGANPDTPYDWQNLLHDLLEMAAMIGFFAALGYIFAASEGLAWIRTYDGARWSLVAMFSVPPLFRILRVTCAGKRERSLMCKHDGFYASVTFLSFVAVLIALMGFRCAFARDATLVVLAIYLLAFVLFNKLIAGQAEGRFARPSGESIAAARDAGKTGACA